MSEQRKIGVYVCHCGGNIADYVDVDQVIAAVKDEPGVAVARAAMFTCSDATQQEILQDISEQGLDGLVVASCSPKLHQFTFRDVARRGQLNPYLYTQVNIREQCSWAHTDDRAGATEKAIRLVRGGIAKTRLSQPLTPVVVETVPRVLIVGAGVAGLRAAVALADIGLDAVVIEKEAVAGGRVAGLGDMYPHGRSGGALVSRLIDEIDRRPRITLLTGAELVEKRGTFGNFQVRVTTGAPGAPGAPGAAGGTVEADVGAVVVATGAETYQPRDGEYGWGLDGVVTLADFERMCTASGDEPLAHRGRPVKSIVYIYCVGSRQGAGGGDDDDVGDGGDGNEGEGEPAGRANRYCSRYCCNAAGHASLCVAAMDPDVSQYHVHRDIRTYGKFEAIYSQSRRQGSVYVRFDESAPPVVTAAGDGLLVRVKDLLTAGEELDIPADLVVLVTGMVPRGNADLGRVLRMPIGQDGFYNEIHPKLRPVETVVDGVLICGACQGPKNSAESVASALAAAAQSAAILKKGYAELDPLIASIDRERCDDCGVCYAACPFEALEAVPHEGREVAATKRGVCKGCGACVPVCAAGAIDLLGYTDEQVRATIDALLEGIA